MDRIEYLKWLLNENERLERIHHEQIKDRVEARFTETNLREDVKKRITSQLNAFESSLSDGAV
jgi:hypothetical protein